MEKWKVEQVRSLQNRIDELDNICDIIANLESYNFSIGTPDGVISWDSINLTERDVDNLRDILLNGVNREISTLEGELDEV